MRRTIFGWAGLAIIVASGTVLAAVGLTAPPHEAPWIVAAAQSRRASLPAGQAMADTATLVAAVVPAPGTTILASPKSDGISLYNAPNGQVVGSLSAVTWFGPTVRPVVSALPGWLEVRLDSRPNGSTAWVAQQNMYLSSTDYRIVISVSQRSLSLYKGEAPIYTAPVGVGKAQWPTPVGPSFVDALIPVPPRQQRVYGPMLIMIGSHSNVFTEFDGGDGQVGIHSYPSNPASTMGVASSHGCVRANPQTIAAIQQVPAGTPIDITP